MKRLPVTRWRLWRIDAVGAVFCVACTATFCLVGIRPLLRSQTDLDARRGQLTAKNAECSRMQASLLARDGHLASIRRALAGTRIQLQPAKHVNQRIAKIAELASGSKLKLDDIRLGKSTDGSRCRTVPISLSGKGAYGDGMVFLRRLNRNFPDTGVTVLELFANPRHAGTMVTFNLELVWYAAPASTRTIDDE